ncbi:MAG: hypothetical protein WA213_20735 [Terriglobales bacterium]
MASNLAGGLFDLFSGDPTQKEQGEFGSLADYGINTGEGATNAANTYYSGILSGNPEEIAQTLAPEIQAGQQQVQQQAQTNAEFGNRGGGTNASTQGAQSNERGNIINLIGNAQQGAAAGEAGIGSNLLGIGSSSLGNEANLAAQNQQREASDVGNVAAGAASIATGFAGGSGDPYEALYNAQQPTGLDTESPDLTDQIQS